MTMFEQIGYLGLLLMFVLMWLLISEMQRIYLLCLKSIKAKFPSKEEATKKTSIVTVTFKTESGDPLYLGKRSCPDVYFFTATTSNGFNKQSTGPQSCLKPLASMTLDSQNGTMKLSLTKGLLQELSK